MDRLRSSLRKQDKAKDTKSYHLSPMGWIGVGTAGLGLGDSRRARRSWALAYQQAQIVGGLALRKLEDALPVLRTER